MTKEEDRLRNALEKVHEGIGLIMLLVPKGTQVKFELNRVREYIQRILGN